MSDNLLEIYRAALEKIARAEGRYSRDPLTHAENTINAMVAVAERALKGIPEEAPDA